MGTLMEPQPDLALLKPRRDYYRHQQPSGRATLLAIEVSDSTLPYDRDLKVPLYARSGVPETWIVDLRNRQILFYREPRTGEYRSHTATGFPGPTPISALPGVTVDLSRLVGDA